MIKNQLINDDLKWQNSSLDIAFIKFGVIYDIAIYNKTTLQICTHFSVYTSHEGQQESVCSSKILALLFWFPTMNPHKSKLKEKIHWLCCLSQSQNVVTCTDPTT